MSHKATHSVVLNSSTNLYVGELNKDLSGTFKMWGRSLVTGSLIKQMSIYVPPFWFWGDEPQCVLMSIANNSKL